MVHLLRRQQLSWSRHHQKWCEGWDDTFCCKCSWVFHLKDAKKPCIGRVRGRDNGQASQVHYILTEENKTDFLTKTHSKFDTSHKDAHLRLLTMLLGSLKRGERGRPQQEVNLTSTRHQMTEAERTTTRTTNLSPYVHTNILAQRPSRQWLWSAANNKSGKIKALLLVHLSDSLHQKRCAEFRDISRRILGWEHFIICRGILMDILRNCTWPNGKQLKKTYMKYISATTMILVNGRDHFV